ncbi:MAG: serpin family protein [Anaerolineae bacterium]
MIQPRRVMLALLMLAVVFSSCAPAVPATPVPSAEPIQSLAPTLEPTPDIAAVPVESPASRPPEEEFDVNANQMAATNGMGLELLQRLSQAAGPGTNLFISPVSVALALGIAANGASGETHEAMLETLHLTGWDENAMNEALAGLGQALNRGDLGVELAIANSLWLREGLPFRQSYLDAIDAYYAAHVSSLDFESVDAPDTINRWVAEQTRDRITEIVTPPIDPQAILFLINAVYFKGDWLEPFDVALTRELPFARADGTSVQAPLMSRYDSYSYVKLLTYQAVRLPYAGDRLSMIVVVPAPGVGIDDWVAGLDARGWAGIAGAMTRKDGNVILPRFTLAFEALLNGPLSDMGMGMAMSPETAGFTRIHKLDQPTWIDQVRHKSFVEVNEKGTEAAAVTSMALRALAAAPEEPFSFVADRPFVYAIQDDTTGAVLFIGVMRDPLQTRASVG